MPARPIISFIIVIVCTSFTGGTAGLGAAGTTAPIDTTTADTTGTRTETIPPDTLPSWNVLQEEEMAPAEGAAEGDAPDTTAAPEEAAGESTTDTTTTATDTTTTTPDTTAAAAGREPPAKSPWGAALRSVAVPGWGQFYTGHRVKGILVASAQVTLAALWQVEKRAADRDYEEYERTGNESTLLRAQNSEQRADDYLSWTILVTLLSGVDAFIDAHLFGFDEHIEMEEKGDEVSVTWRF